MPIIAPIPSLPSLLSCLALAVFAPSASGLDRAHSDTLSVPALAGKGTGGDADTAVFAGGSFWCMEAALEVLPGVDSVTAGYALGPDSADRPGAQPLPGHNPPDFESVSTGTTAYVEAVRVVFHPKRIGYGKLLDAYWRNIDPTRADGQFSDDGKQFRPILFYADEGQKAAAESSRKRLADSKRFRKPIAAAIAPAAEFHPAEPMHQDYYKRNAARYRTYVEFSGREAFLRKAWGPSKVRKSGAPEGGAGSK
ncbi:MAG: peptide methionine sulfoxide reductase [Fibrobacteres bacterium]|nr:peptide methionine sulfoxide reductase [Fibrobacterota bacterium]